MLISNGEFAPVVEALPFIIRDVPDLLRVVSRMDNSVVEENLESKSAGNPTNLECLLVVEVISWIFGIDVESIRVKSEDNIRTDAGSRPDLFDEYVKQMREWSALKGKPVVQVEVPPSWKERRAWLQSKHSGGKGEDGVEKDQRHGQLVSEGRSGATFQSATLQGDLSLR